MGGQKTWQSRFLSDSVLKWPWLCFRAHLHRFGPTIPPRNVRSALERSRTLSMCSFHCPRFLEDRETLERALGERPSRDTIVGLMLESEEKWVAVGIAATNILRELRHVERQRAGERYRNLKTHKCREKASWLRTPTMMLYLTVVP